MSAEVQTIEKEGRQDFTASKPLKKNKDRSAVEPPNHAGLCEFTRMKLLEWDPASVVFAYRFAGTICVQAS